MTISVDDLLICTSISIIIISLISIIIVNIIIVNHYYEYYYQYYHDCYHNGIVEVHLLRSYSFLYDSFSSYLVLSRVISSTCNFALLCFTVLYCMLVNCILLHLVAVSVFVFVFVLVPVNV